MTASRKRRSVFFACAAIVAFAGCTNPLADQLVDRSFAWHMVQHIVLLFIVPLFVLEAHPFAWLGSPRKPWQRASLTAVKSAPVTTITSPAGALLIWIAVLWGVHMTPLYELSLEHPLVHVCEHALVLAAGMLFWIPIVAPPPFKAPPHAMRVLYLFVALPQGALLSIALLMARRPLYHHYAGPSALDDQHAAAAVMWIGGGAILLVAFLMLVARWAARERYAAATPLVALLVFGTLLAAHANAASTIVPSYTAGQSRAGQTLYYENCAECHGDTLAGHYGPPLRGSEGNLQWESVQYVYQYMTEHMPAGNAEGLSQQHYLDIMAFIMSQHHHAAGSKPLTAAAANASTALLGP